MKNLLNKLLITFLVIASSSYANAAKTITYFHNDALGSPVAATDENGNVLWREAYKPYGSRILKQDNGTNDTWYTGKQEDSASGLSYFGARWYDPTIGRFMGIDPVDFQEGNIHSFNRYAYANNNPYRFLDPDGKRAVGLNIGGGGVIDPFKLPIPGFKFAGSLIIAFDTNSYEISLLRQFEGGLGKSSSKYGQIGVFGNAIIGTESTTIDDLKGLGGAASGSIGKGRIGMNGSVSLPQNGSYDNEKGFSEAGVAFGTKGSEFGLTITKTKELHRFTFIKDTVNKVKGLFSKN